MSKIPNRSPQHVCKHPCDRRPKVGKLHCLRRRAIALPHSLRLRTPTGTVAAAVARWSKIERVDDRHHYVCQHRRDQRPKVTRDPRSGTLSAVAAQMLSNTGFGCARPRAQSPHLGLTLPPRVGLMHLRHATRSGREIRGSDNRLRIAPRGCARCHESDDSCAPVRVAAPPLDPPATICLHASTCAMHRHKAVEKSENPRTGSATRAALALAVPVPRRTTAARRPGSPHLGLPLPPTRWPTVHLRRATPKGREMRESENRLRSARHACICCSKSDDSCAPVQVAASRVAPPATRWPTVRMHHAMPHQGVENPRVRESAPQRAPHAARAHAVPSRTTAVHLFASPHLRLPRPPRVAPCHQGVEKCESPRTGSATR